MGFIVFIYSSICKILGFSRSIRGGGISIAATDACTSTRPSRRPYHNVLSFDVIAVKTMMVYGNDFTTVLLLIEGQQPIVAVRRFLNVSCDKYVLRNIRVDSVLIERSTRRTKIILLRVRGMRSGNIFRRFRRLKSIFRRRSESLSIRLFIFTRRR